MDKIKLLYVENVITRQTTTVQELSFVVLVRNLSYEKSVDVKWAGEDGIWHTLPARYHSSVDQDKEYWVARKPFTLLATKSLPGNVRFAVRYRVLGKEYWDNNQGENYSIQADSGIKIAHDIPCPQHPVREMTCPTGRRYLPDRGGGQAVPRARKSHHHLDQRQLAYHAAHALPLQAQLLGLRIQQQRQESQSLRRPDLERRTEVERRGSGPI